MASDPTSSPDDLVALLKQVSALEPESEVAVAKNNANTLDMPVVPVILVPGVMGTRLRWAFDGAVWDPDVAPTMLSDWVTPSVKDIRNRFKSDSASVVQRDPIFDIPGLVDNGSSQVVSDPYLSFITFLSTALNFSGAANSGKCPVHAVGYDWTQSNTQSAAHLDGEVKRILGLWKAKKAILVTHSMGGLVARAACVTRIGFADRIAGIVHTVQPAGGASVAYRRFLTGANDSGSFFFDKILGNEWWKYMALMSVLPGPLQLLPTDNYRRTPADAPWLFHLHGIHGSSSPPKDVPVAQSPIVETYLNTIFPGIVFSFDPAISGFSSAEWLAVQKDLMANLAVAAMFHKTLGLLRHPTTFILASTENGGTDAGVIGTDFDSAPFFKSTTMSVAGDGTVPRASADLLAPTEDGVPVADPDTAKPARRLVGDVGPHKSVLDNAKTRDFILNSVRYLFQKAAGAT